jgi:CHRD domain
MKRRKWLGTLATLCVLSPSLTYGDDDVPTVLENPAHNQSVGGIGVVSGWTFVRGDKEERVKLRVDGVTQDIRLACCTARADVDATVPGAPDNTGFGMLVNFSNLSPGPHLIGVDSRSADAFDDFFDDQERTVIDHNVYVVRPGNTNFLTGLNLNGSTCSVDSATNELRINNVQLTSAQGTSSTNLHLGFAPNSQSFVIADSSDMPAITRFVAHLNGSQETPLVKSSATGEAALTLNADNSLTCTVTTTDTANATAAHIHLAPAGTAGPIILPLTGGPSTWACPSTALTAGQLTGLQNGHLYINVHTPNHPDGEIRGQIVAAPLTS